MHATANLEEADRLMTICNSCRYCEGLCAVFPAMEMRRAFSDGDLNYLANLCHSCGACYADCQFSPPHEFDVNVPKVLAKVRTDSWKRYAWPAALQTLFDRNGTLVAVVTALSITAFFLGFVAFQDPSALWAADGRFYRLMPHDVMAALFGGAAVYALLAMSMGLRAFWIDTSGPKLGVQVPRPFLAALSDVLTLRYLDGGGVGCMNEDEEPTDRRRLYHHFTFYGFMLCFASTCTATVYHYIFAMEAPYGFNQLPKILGTVGGGALLIGTAGLFHAKLVRDRALVDTSRSGMDIAFIVMLFLTAASGLALALTRQTPLLAVALASHLGFVFALFLTMPYGRFVHGVYRAGALVRYAMERTGP